MLIVEGLFCNPTFFLRINYGYGQGKDSQNEGQKRFHIFWSLIWSYSLKLFNILFPKIPKLLYSLFLKNHPS